MNKKCRLCGNSDLNMFHKGVRDDSNIDVLRCNHCGLLMLSSFKQIENFYEDEHMRKNQYNSITNSVSDETWDLWIEETKEDDDRRFRDLNDICKDKKVCDFGCGNGGFLRRIRNISKDVVGIELDNTSVEMLQRESIKIQKDITKLEEKYDVITMFQVIEHLEEPDKILKQIYDRLEVGGRLIVETPNADDALISFYESEKFKDFTFWSPHLMLYNSDNLETLIKSVGFKTIDNGQIQRYPLSNHLFWLENGKPGGHNKWTIFNDSKLNKEYVRVLKEINACDTLFSIFCK